MKSILIGIAITLVGSIILSVVLGLASDVTNPKPEIVDNPSGQLITQNKDIAESDNIDTSKAQDENSKPEINLRNLEKRIHELVNLERQKNGLNTLAWNENIASIAREHSKDMVNRDYFSHDSPEGLSGIERGISAGYTECGTIQAIQLGKEIDSMYEQLDNSLKILNAKERDYDSDLLEYETSGSESQYRILEQNRQELNRMVDEYNSETNAYNEKVLKLNRMSEQGMYGEGLAENLFQISLYESYTTLNGVPVNYDWYTTEKLAQEIVSGWMESEEHRYNILGYSHQEGIGVAVSSDDFVYATQNFC